MIYVMGWAAKPKLIKYIVVLIFLKQNVILIFLKALSLVWIGLISILFL
jgi:hypothetical protein